MGRRAPGPTWRGARAGLAAIVLPALVVLGGAAQSAAPATSLGDLARARGLLLGGAVGASLFDPDDPDYAGVVRRDYNAVVTENAMKWNALHAGAGTYVFDLADAVVGWAAANGKTVRGHTLLWHDSVPAWVYGLHDRAAMSAAVEDHITTVMRHFTGKVPIWDVVNEAVSDAPGHPLRSSPFLEVLGPDYLASAFRWAHAADPSARLFYNDYNIEGQNGKSDAVYQLVKALLDRGVPINGVGFQTHVSTSFSVEGSGMVKNLQRFRDLGLDVQLTEVDVQLEPDGAESVQLARQASVYGDLLQACLKVHCSAFMMWGVSDLSSWRAAGRPLIFDDDYRPKPAYAALLKVLQTAP